ncbi:hypothetical protein DE146DRAFT_184076 [Phaeosphaeria sp. MPI-PUGE-AT-0046c]|nr:hypothetical protein DE146DRAFT_184076 [Phaeosphaeria sp. MPI-PUGE-AT-0046c]
MSWTSSTLELVIVYIGEDAVQFQVYRELVMSVSPFFRGAFKGDFKEATDHIIPLRDTWEATIQIFLQWADAQLHSCGRFVGVPRYCRTELRAQNKQA